MQLSFSARPAGNEVIGIDLGTTNSCVAVMEGKVRGSCTDSFFLPSFLFFWFTIVCILNRAINLTVEPESY
jgi:molecular chaperone DnaK (HSP70)